MKKAVVKEQGNSSFTTALSYFFRIDIALPIYATGSIAASYGVGVGVTSSSTMVTDILAN